MIGSITTVISAIFWGLVVLSVLVFVHEGGHYLSARACGMRVTEFFLGMPCRYRLAWKSKTHGTVYGVTPILLGGYTRICGMEGEEDELLADCLAFVQERGRASAHDVAERLGVDEDRALDMLVTLSDWASIEPFYNPDKGEYEGQKDYPQEFRTLARDGHLRTEYDKGCDLTEEGSTQAGEPRAITLSASDFLAVERSQTYLGKGFWKRVVTLFAGPLVNVLVCIAIITVGLSAVGTDVAQNTNTLGVVDEGELIRREREKAILDVYRTPAPWFDWDRPAAVRALAEDDRTHAGRGSVQKVKEALRQNGAMKTAEVEKAVCLSNSCVSSALHMLENEGKVRKSRVPNTGRVTYIWELT